MTSLVCVGQTRVQLDVDHLLVNHIEPNRDSALESILTTSQMASGNTPLGIVLPTSGCGFSPGLRPGFGPSQLPQSFILKYYTGWD